MAIAEISVAHLTSYRRRPGPTASIRRDDVRGARLRAAARRSLRLVVVGGFRRHDVAGRAGKISKITVASDTKLSAASAGAEWGIDAR